MKYIIREIKKEEYVLLEHFLYEAIFIPVGVEPPPKTIINMPELQEYIAAEVEGEIIGSVWVRIMNDYGHIDDDTPSLAMSLYKEYRGLGIGTALLKEILLNLKLAGYTKVSLSVQKDNYAVKLYKKVGFTVYDENEEEYIMVTKLN